MEYDTLKIIWWFFLSGLFAMFFILGGRDLGVFMLMPFISKTDDERRLIINSIGSTWEGNQVWFITAAGATFAAWPMVYATAFSGLYIALFLVLITFILKPPGIDYRSKIPKALWRTLWDWALFLSAFVPTLILGVGLANLLLGLPFHFDEQLRSHYEGSFWQLLNPFSILFGCAAICILSFHGGQYLQGKLPEEFTAKLKWVNTLLGLSFITLFVLLGIWVIWGINGYKIQSLMPVNENLIPTLKQVIVVPQGWLNNYSQLPWLWLLPVATLLMVVIAMISAIMNFAKTGVFFSALTLVAALLTVNATLFPFILPSSTHPSHSLTLWDATSSHKTLQYMFWVTVIFLPIVSAYTAWVFKVVSGKLNKQDVLNSVESY